MSLYPGMTRVRFNVLDISSPHVRKKPPTCPTGMRLRRGMRRVRGMQERDYATSCTASFLCSTEMLQRLCRHASRPRDAPLLSLLAFHGYQTLMQSSAEFGDSRLAQHR
jgi:hypothetical protein